MYQNGIKRGLDILLSLCCLILLSPLMLIIAITVLIDDGAPAIFRQQRVGKGGKDFTIYKFRTMKRLSPQEIPTANLSRPYSYMTRTGRFLRLFSLDELPQFLNILKGDMSLVGPRPLIRREQKMILLRGHNHIDCMRPGLTGWAQVNGRDSLAIEEKIALEQEYVKKCGFWMDLKIGWKTLGVVLSGKGYQEGRHGSGTRSRKGKPMRWDKDDSKRKKVPG